MSRAAPDSAELPTILAFTPRERARALVRAAFPKRKFRVLSPRDATEFSSTIRRILVDAAVVDVGSPLAIAALSNATNGGSVGATNGDDTWKIAALAQEFPSAPFFAVTPLRATDAPVVARCSALEFCDVIADGIDDHVARDIIAPQTFSARFFDALGAPPPALRLETQMQLKTWRAILVSAGRPVRTSYLAKAAGVSREHLSRNFSERGSPNLKRVIDLVRMIAAAELAKNPGLDIKDVAKILGFASSSHLAVTAQRVLGTRPASLSRLRTIDLIERFMQGRTRSRG
ncbi:MAG TPA: helix-turn-helix domain-containing protein [Gemmatimonadaceae bacterium]|nr:helix-turn-helix domain-containing protein [Gemmatimonadaceae bacterium]